MSDLRMSTIAGIDVSPDHFIGGRRVASDETFEVISPIDGSHLADVSRAGAAEVDMAVARCEPMRSPSGRRWAPPAARPTCAGWPT